MLCIAALIVFSILGIFSASHRELAKEAFDCVLRRITLRPCDTGFKEKIKGRILARLLERSVFAARLFNKHFELLSFVFVAMMLASTAWVIRSGYNYFFYGSCNGLNASGFCAFDAGGENNKVTNINASCGLEAPVESDLRIAPVDVSTFPSLNQDGKVKVVFIGCYECDYTRKIYPHIKKMAEDDDVNLIFMHYPAKHDTEILNRFDYCAWQADSGKFWPLNDKLFSEDKERIMDKDYLRSLADTAGYDSAALMKCVEERNTKLAVADQVSEMEKSGLYGTPTIFIGDKAFVGPKPYRVYRFEILKEKLFR